MFESACAQGLVTVLCNYRGVNEFPFIDVLTCDIDVGGWLLSGLQMGLAVVSEQPTLTDSGSEEAEVSADGSATATCACPSRASTRRRGRSVGTRRRRTRSCRSRWITA